MVLSITGKNSFHFLDILALGTNIKVNKTFLVQFRKKLQEIFEIPVELLRLIPGLCFLVLLPGNSRKPKFLGGIEREYWSEVS